MIQTQNKLDQNLAFREHLTELRRRLFYCLILFVVGASIGWVYNTPLTKLLQRPLGQQLYYSDPTGGLGFIIQIALFVGLLVATPVIIHQLLQFIRPISQKISTWLVVRFVIISFMLAGAGVAFAYFLSLPAALKFLMTINTAGVSALISADKYLSFVMTYLLSFAVIFQLPLILLFINQITPLSGGKLMRYQRPVIIVSFVAAAILTPTPDPFNQLIMAMPMIILYQVAAMAVLASNKLRGVKVKDASSATMSSARKAPLAKLQSDIEPIIEPGPERIIPKPVHSAGVAQSVARSVSPRMNNILDLNVKQRCGRKQPSSNLFHNSNLPKRSFDLKRTHFAS